MAGFLLIVAIWLIGFWLGTGACWFHSELYHCPKMSIRMRLWRAATWLPAWIAARPLSRIEDWFVRHWK